MECFESAYIEQLDQILTAALAYEAKLKSEKAELRNFVAKLSDVFQHDWLHSFQCASTFVCDSSLSIRVVFSARLNIILVIYLRFEEHS